MKNTITITEREFKAIHDYAEFMRTTPPPCDDKCGPPGSPDRRACCGCPDYNDWDQLVKGFKRNNLISDDILRDINVKRLIESYQRFKKAEETLKAAKEELYTADLVYKRIKDIFIIEEEKV
jgi:hypothetical protein